MKQWNEESIGRILRAVDRNLLLGVLIKEGIVSEVGEAQPRTGSLLEIEKTVNQALETLPVATVELPSSLSFLNDFLPDYLTSAKEYVLLALKEATTVPGEAYLKIREKAEEALISVDDIVLNYFEFISKLNDYIKSLGVVPPAGLIPTGGEDLPAKGRPTDSALVKEVRYFIDQVNEAKNKIANLHGEDVKRNKGQEDNWIKNLYWPGITASINKISALVRRVRTHLP